MASTARLHPQFKPWADMLLAFAKDIDIRFHFTSTFRTRAQQADLYRRFLKGERGLYHVLPAGRSMHELGLAVDLARFNVPADEDELLPELGQQWIGLGGVWGGDDDPVHFAAPFSWRR